MLPRWTRPLEVALSARGAAWADAGASGYCPGVPAEAFAAALAAPARPPRAVSLLLASDLVHYLLLPWPAEVEDEAEGTALAEHHFHRVFGEAARDWSVRFDPDEAGLRLACAVNRPLLETLRAAARAARCRLRSVQPFLVSAFNHWRAELGTRQALFVTLEAGRWCAVQVANGEWRALRTGRLEGEPAEALDALVERERALAGARMEALVYAPGFAPFDLTGERVRLLSRDKEPLHAPTAH